MICEIYYSNNGADKRNTHTDAHIHRLDKQCCFSPFQAGKKQQHSDKQQHLVEQNIVIRLKGKTTKSYLAFM